MGLSLRDTQHNVDRPTQPRDRTLSRFTTNPTRTRKPFELIRNITRLTCTRLLITDRTLKPKAGGPHQPNVDLTTRMSLSIETPLTLVSPDLAVCPNCLQELFDRKDRRYLYPFINCTDCGPRYTIVEALPYDRPNTTMRVFAMCENCRREYEDPLDRRFHAQPVACPAMGPHLWLTDENGAELAERDEAITQAADALKEGKVVAVKGLGGFHLAVDASNDDAVSRLRERKNRERKPLAIMCRDLDTVRSLVQLDAESNREDVAEQKSLDAENE